MTPETSLIRWLDHNSDRIKAVLLDIDGVLLNKKRRLPGSLELLELLQRKGIPFVLLTNDGNHSPEEKAERLNIAGLAIAPDQILSCGHAIKPLIQSMSLTGERFFAMGDTGTPCYAENAGLTVTRELNRLQSCKGVIIGEEHYNWEPVINAVINFYIDHPGAPLIIPNPDEFYPGPELKIHVAAGGVGRFIQNVLKAYGTDITPIYLGKPYAPIFQLTQQVLRHTLAGKVLPSEILMVGDNIEADIKGGLAMGYQTALMLTGVTELTALDQYETPPDLIFQAL